MGARTTRIRLCGRLSVELDGRPVEDALPGRQGRLLFAYLALHRGRPVRRDELLEALWPDGSPPAGDPLAPPLSRLRKALGPHRLEGRTELSLLLPDGAWVDWEAVHAGVDAAREALGAGRFAEARATASEVASIAEQGLLPGLEAPWIETRRTTLADLRIEALETAATAGLRQGGPQLPVAEATARAAVEAAPFRESARALLIEVLRARGNVAEALRAYEDVRLMLREELGSTPGPALVALHEQLLRADPVPAVPVPEVVVAPRPAPPAEALVERDREVTAVTRVVDAAFGGQGRLLAIEGPAGIGKTRLLNTARDQATARGALVLTGRGGELEREFPFGVVRQLFETVLADPATRERALAGAAAPAKAVFGVPDVPGPDGHDGGDASFAVLHGLFWIALNLAGERPLVLAIDDLQWADKPSLRFVAYLVRRLEGVPLLLAATVRTGEPDVDEALLAELADDPSTVALRPGPLTRDGVTGLVRARLGSDAETAFCAACHAATGGNPLFLRQLLGALEADGIQPVAESADVVRRIGPRAVSRTVLLRMGRLPEAARAVARAAAVLGESAELATVAALAGLDERATADAVAALTRAEVLRPEAPPIGFVHPLVRDAVYHDLGPGERELQHAAAARVLRDAGAAPEHVATHLLVVPRRGDEAVVDVLVAAAAGARRAAAAESAVAYLRRALEEPPSPTRRPAVEFELGVAEALTSGTAAVAHLRAGWEQLADPMARARAGYALAKTVLFTESAIEAARIARVTREQLPPDLADAHHMLESLEHMAVYFGGAAPTNARALRRYRDGPPGDGPGAMAVACVAAYEWTGDVGPADACAELALASIADGQLYDFDAGLMGVVAGVVLALAEREEALRIWDELLAHAFRRGDRFTALGVYLWRGFTLARRGDLVGAQELLRDNVAQLASWGDAVTAPFYSSAFEADVLLDRGQPEAAAQALRRADPAWRLGGTLLRSNGSFFWRCASARVALAEGRPNDALTVLEDLRSVLPPDHDMPMSWPHRTLRAQALAQLGRSAEAIVLVEAELAIVERFGVPGASGRTLRVLGVLQGGVEGLATLERAVERLDRSIARLDLALALADLGEALLRRGDGDAALAHLWRAHDLAVACGADALVLRVRQAMLGAGVAPKAVEASGAAALTGTERRIAALAAEGRAPRDIAQALFMTPHAVEVHLATALGKLGVASVDEVAAVLPAEAA